MITFYFSHLKKELMLRVLISPQNNLIGNIFAIHLRKMSTKIITLTPGLLAGERIGTISAFSRKPSCRHICSIRSAAFSSLPYRLNFNVKVSALAYRTVTPMYVPEMARIWKFFICMVCSVY
jgi:hypothetical protein